MTEDPQDPGKVFPDLLTDLTGLGEDDPLESDRMPAPGMYKHKIAKYRQRFIKKTDDLKRVITELPEPGYSYHYISAGAWDFYTVIPVFISLFPGPIDETYVTTWTMSRDNAYDILKNFDDGKIKKINLLTGIYFKRRETAVYSVLVNGLLKRKQRYVATKNHTKIILMRSETDFLICEGSANLTANPRVEQYVINNDQGLYEFHAAWMDDLLDSEKNKKAGRNLI